MRVLIPRTGGVRLAGLGAVAGSVVRDNAALCAAGYPEPPAFIERATGIRARRQLGPGESVGGLAARACRRALGGTAPDTVDSLVLATSAPERLLPPAATRLHRALGLRGAPAHTINAACSGFVFGLDLAARGLLTGDACALVCAAEARSAQVSVTDRATGALFGDAAGAALLRSGPAGAGLLAVGTVTEPPEEAAIVLGRGASDRLEMRDGPQVYFAAVEGMAALSAALLEASGLAWADIDLVVPHQANGRILRRFCWMVGLDEARSFSNLERYGNTSAASIPLATQEAILSGRVGAGAVVMWLAVGAGGAGGAALVQLDGALVEAVRETGPLPGSAGLP